nr:hypothetical protein CFP56_44439 [Quercus suber]
MTVRDVRTASLACPVTGIPEDVRATDPSTRIEILVLQAASRRAAFTLTSGMIRYERSRSGMSAYPVAGEVVDFEIWLAEPYWQPTTSCDHGADIIQYNDDITRMTVVAD